MEEDIKILEEFIKEPQKEEEIVRIGSEEYKLPYFELEFKPTKKIAQAIENLIARNKELEVINKMQKYRISVIDERELIPKSKIKEKIEELKERVTHLMNSGVDLTWKEYYEAQIDMLQELLEE